MPSKSKHKKAQCMPFYTTVLKICCHLKFAPYVWDKKTSRLAHSSRSSYIWFLIIALGFPAIKVLYVGARFVKLYLWPTEAMLRSQIVCSGVLFSSWSAFAIHAIFFAAPLNLYLNTDGAMKLCNFLLEARKQRKQLWSDLAITKFMCTIYVFRMYQLIISTMSPNSPDFMYGVLPSALQNRFTFACYVLISSYECMICWVSSFIVLTMAVYVSTVKCLLKEGLGPSSTIKEALVNYKTCWILSNIHQESFSNFYTLWMTIYCLLTMILCTFGTIHFYGKITTRVYMSMPISIVTIASFSHYFYTCAGKHPGYFAKAARSRFQGMRTKSSMDAEVRQCLSSGRVEIPSAETFTSWITLPETPTLDSVVSLCHTRSTLSRWPNHFRAEMRTTFQSCKAPLITLGSTFPVRRSQILKMSSFVLIQTMRMLILAGTIPTEAPVSILP